MAQLEQETLGNGVEDNLDTNYDFLIKVLLVGDTGVGKTCFLHQYTDGEFKEKFIATVGVDFRIKKLTYEFPEDGEDDPKKKIHLQLWDTAGQERYRSLTKAFFRDAMGFLLLFDLSRESSFQSVRQWIGELKEQAYCENPDTILVGNKKDLENWEVKSSEAEKIAKDLGITYIEASAATGENVELAVNTLLDMVMRRMRDYVSTMDADQRGAVPPEVQKTTGQTSSVAVTEPVAEEPKKSSCAC